MADKGKIKSIGKALYYKSLCMFLDPKVLDLDPYEHSKLKYWLTKMVPGSKQSAVQLSVKGKVAGVGYRDWIKRRAKLKGLNSWTRNMGKDQVEVLLVGNAKDIEDVIRSAWRGPKRAEVMKVKEKWFNKPIKVKKSKDGTGGEEVAWSQETADKVTQTLNQLGSLLKEPNHYKENTRDAGTDELIKECEQRELFNIRCLLKDLYVVGPDKVLGFERSQTTNVPSMIHSLVDQKHLTKILLEKAKLNVAEGGIFRDFEEAKEYLEKSTRPLVVKPAVGLNGSGVTVDVRTPEALKAAWDYATKFHNEVVMEELIVGVDIRVLVIGGKGKAAYIRVPANIKGDGQKTVEELIDEKNQLRLRHPHLRKSLIISDAYTSSFLKRQGYTFKSIPKKDEFIFLQLKANISKGGDSVNITEYIHPDLFKLAEEAVKVFNLQDYCGLDLLVEAIDKPRDEQKCTIIELNSTANLEGVKHPLYGTPYNAAEALMNHLFGEKEIKQNYPIVYKNILITGLLPIAFLDWAAQKAEKIGVKGNLQQKGQVVEGVLAGPKNQVFSYIETLRDFKDGTKGIVDGIFLEDAEPITLEDFFIQVAIDGTNSNLSLLKDYGKDTKFIKNPLLTAKGNHYEESNKEDNDNLNFQVFKEAFKKRGYDTRHLYKDLLEVKNKEKTQIVGMHYSSYFCDQIADRWYPTKDILSLAGFSVPRGATFKVNNKEKEQALWYFNELNQPCIATQIIPENSKKASISNSKELKSLWKEAGMQGIKYILIEEDVPGWQICVPVLLDKAEKALAIVPASITGDGRKTIQELIKEKNTFRSQNPYYNKRNIEVNEVLEGLLKSQGYQLEDVLEKNKDLRIQTSASLIEDGETISFEKELHHDFTEIATKAVKAIPGLEFAYVYMTIPSPTQPAKEQKWAINRIDTTPELGKFQFPWEGNSIPLVEKVIDQLCLTERAIEL